VVLQWCNRQDAGREGKWNTVSTIGGSVAVEIWCTVTTVLNRMHIQVLQMAKHKFASNVVEKCFAHCSRDEREGLIDEVTPLHWCNIDVTPM
jgi:hypothetical protein